VAECPCNASPDPFLEYCTNEGVFWSGFGDVTVGGSNLCDLAYNALGLPSDPDSNIYGQTPGYYYDRVNHIWLKWPLTELAYRLDISDLDSTVWYSINDPSAAISGIWKDANVLLDTPEFEVTLKCTLDPVFGDVDTGKSKAFYVSGASLTTLVNVYGVALNIDSSTVSSSSGCVATKAINTGLPSSTYYVNAIAVDKSNDNPWVALDSGNSRNVYKLSGSSWSQVSLGTNPPLKARDISLGNDGTVCYVSIDPAFPNSNDYKIYTYDTNGVSQEVGAGLFVDCWDKYNLIYSDSVGIAHILHADDPDFSFC
jgi:hypothetical protein